MMKKKLFITGANGQIGSYIIKKLKKNYQIFGFDKDFNFNDIKSLNKIMKKISMQLYLHMVIIQLQRKNLKKVN